MTGIPSEKEEQYFIEQEMKRLKKLHDEHLREQADEERQRMKELHFMHCTKCGQRMEATLLQGIEIEVCPDCGGIYLDAGELQKIMDEKKWGPISGALSYARKVWGEL